MSAIQTTTKYPEVPQQKIPAPSASSPRKRRRKPAAGASDDCFACQERQTPCDRRRPYCTPCLDQGKDCSGYKTTLTWGVGVASRGKLRGLSLPIATAKRAAPTGDVDDKKSGDAPRKAPKLGSSRKSSASSESSQPRSAPTPTVDAASNARGRANSTTYDFVNIDPTSTTTPTSPITSGPSFDWQAAQALAHGKTSRFAQKKQRRHTLQPLQMPTSHPSRDYGVMPMTASIVGGYGHSDPSFASQISPMIPTFTGYGLISPTYTNDFSHQPNLAESPIASNFYPSPETLGWDRDDLSSTFGSDQSSQGFGDEQSFLAGFDMLPPSDFSAPLIPTVSTPESNALVLDNKFTDFSTNPSLQLCPDDVGEHPTAVSIPPTMSTLTIGNTPKLQFLIDYYNKVISPVIVAFDGPNNPYRAHILSLAAESETLQHAIAALAAGNIRIRRTHNPTSTNRSMQGSSDSSHDHSVRRSSYAHSLMDVGMESLPQTSASEPCADELYYKAASVKALNEQLADPNRRRDDSILATLLILCLYHICDTGVGKFKTQFAGVKKILALRGGTRGSNSKATNWLTIMFTWFDAMTASINDREGQLLEDEIDTSSLSPDEWALENLAGCDSRLFKAIAKLGRLNMLSQNKPVAEASPRSSPKASNASSNRDYYSMGHNRFDGNGWSTLQTPEPEKTDNDNRTQFWKEWSEVRRALQEWQLDDSVRSTPVESTSPESDRRDIYHISESFRYSALLYTERLAYPHLSSSHPNFQNLVTQGLYHITNVKSDVFLLWPLFITGTECVSEHGRHLIRERCLDIQKDSGFFNNISGLELLENIWRDDCQESSGNTSALPIEGATLHQQQPITGMVAGEYSAMTVSSASAFRWRKAMQKVDGEYIVV